MRRQSVQRFDHILNQLQQLVLRLHGAPAAARTSNWIKAQVIRARLVEGRDFASSPSRATSGQPTIEYHLTLEAGKHVAMLSETDKGFEVREYFIERERHAVAPTPTRPLSPAEMFLRNAQMMVDIERRQLAQGEQIERVEQCVEEIAEGQIFTLCPTNA